MDYIVKYITNALKNDIDIEKLYINDLQMQSKIILVCSEEYANLMLAHNITVINNVEDLSKQLEFPVCVATNTDGKLLAAYLACKLKASKCQIYMQKAGFYTLDNVYEENGKFLTKIDYDEAMELACSGYNAVDIELIEYAKKNAITIELLSYYDNNKEGTLIKEVLSHDGYTIKGVIKDPNVVIVTLTDIPDEKGVSYKIFDAVAKSSIVVGIILLPAANGSTQDISFTVNKSDKIKTENTLKSIQKEIGFKNLKLDEHTAKISIIGSAIHNNYGVAATVFKVLYENNIDIKLINTSEIKIVVVVDKKDADTAVQKIHQAFIK